MGCFEPYLLKSALSYSLMIGAHSAGLTTTTINTDVGVIRVESTDSKNPFRLANNLLAGERGDLYSWPDDLPPETSLVVM